METIAVVPYTIPHTLIQTGGDLRKLYSLMKSTILSLLIGASMVQFVHSETRPWCLDGVGLCRGITPASGQYSHSMTIVLGDAGTRPKAVLLGGQRSSAASSLVSLSSVSTLDVTDMTLLTEDKVKFDIGNASRPQHSGHVALPYNGSVLLFGGVVVNRTESRLPVATNEVIWLDPGNALSSPVWRVLFNRTSVTRAEANAATVPTSRQNAAAAISGNTLWIFGGLDNNTLLLNDTWSFNLINRSWTRHSPAAGDVIPGGSGAPDSGLHKAAMIATPDGRFLLLYGGRSRGSQLNRDRTVPSEPQNELWAFQISTRTWLQVDMNLDDKVNPACNEAALMLLQADGGSGGLSYELVVASSGFWKPSTNASLLSYKMWIALKQSDTGGSFLEHLKDVFNSTVVRNSSNPIPFVNQQIFLSNKNRIIQQIDARNTILNASLFNQQLPFPERMLPFKDAAMALHLANRRGVSSGSSTSSQQWLQLLISGGQDITGKASSKLLIVDFENLKTIIDTSTKLKPGLISGNKVMRYGTHLVAPRYPQLLNKSYGSDVTDFIIYTGADFLEDDDEPQMTEFVVVDAAEQKVLPRCSYSNQAQNTCKVLPVPRGNIPRDSVPAPRDGLAMIAMYQIFMKSYGGAESAVGGKLLFMYGGMQLVGDSLNNTTVGDASGDSFLTQDEQALRDTLASCDTQGSLDSIALDSMAQCSLPQVKTILTPTSDYEAYENDVSYTTTAYSDYEHFGRPPTVEFEAPVYPPPEAPSLVLPSLPTTSLRRHRRRAAEELHNDQGTAYQGVEEEGSRGDHDTQGWDGEDLTGSTDSSDELRGHSIHANGLHRTSNRQLRTSGRVRARWQHSRRLSTDATRVWGNRATAAAANVREASQRKQKLTLEQAFRLPDTSEGTKVYGTAYAVLWQSNDDISDPQLHLVDPYPEYISASGILEAVLPGPAFYYDPLRNINGSEFHAPGERAAATLAGLPYIEGQATNADAILFGGLTAVNKSEENNMLGVPQLTNDVYYLQYIPAVSGGYDSTSDMPQPRFQSCPFTESSCISVASFPQGTSDMDPLGSFPMFPPSDEYTGPLYEDCPAELYRLPAGVEGTYQLRVYRGVNKTQAMSMAIRIRGVSNISFSYSSSMKGADIAQGICCAGNSSLWAWPPTNDTTKKNEYWITLPNGVYDIIIQSKDGSGFVSQKDMLAPFNCSVNNTSRCPRIELYNLESNRLIRGMGGFGEQAAVFFASPNATDVVSRTFRISLCGSNPPPPPSSLPPSSPLPSESRYPFAIENWPNMLRSFELQLAADHNVDAKSLPQGRMWHASCFVETKDLPGESGFGKEGLLVVHGGVANHVINDIDVETELLEDLWVFDLEYRWWLSMTGGGENPGKRLRHTMAADGTIVFLSGGYTYDADTQDWPYDTSVFYIDFQLGIDAVWMQIDGNDAVLGRRTSPSAITQGMGVSRRRSHLITLNDQGINFVPLPTSAKLEANSNSGNSSAVNNNNSTSSNGNSTSSNSTSTPASANTFTAAALEASVSVMYDGDLLLLPKGTDLSISGVVSVNSAVVFYGTSSKRVPAPPPPPSTPTTNHRRAALLQQQVGTRLGSYVVSADAHDEVAEHNMNTGPTTDTTTTEDCTANHGGGCSSDMAAQTQLQHARGSQHGWRTWSDNRKLLPQSELQAALKGKSHHMSIISDPVARRASQEAARESLEDVRRMLQASSLSSSSVSGSSLDINVTQWLSVSRTRATCSPGGVFQLQSAASFVNVEFVGCQLDVYSTNGATVSIVNCVFRDTLDRPAILIRPDGRVSIQGSLFFNNTFVSRNRNSSDQLSVGNATSASNSSSSSNDSDLFWGAGSAIYVMARGVIEAIEASAFVNNGNGPGSSRGGAIFLTGPGACLDLIKDCAFKQNGRFSTGSGTGSFLGGGAIYGFGTTGCDVDIRGTWFSSNTGGNGGAVMLSETGVRNLSFTNVTFWNNTAVMAGGGLYVSSASGRLLLRDTMFVSNTAPERGGGISLESVGAVTANGLWLESNVARLGVGGGLAHSRQGVLELQRCTVLNNTALYGGGVGCSQDVDVRLTDSQFLKNSATAHAGGLECYLCYMFTANSTSFIRNSAPSGGGLALTKVEAGGLLSNVTLYNNTGMPTDGTISKIDQAGCARDVRGGGGGLCLDLQRTVTLNGVSIRNNRAVVGGGFFVQQHCTMTDTGCGAAVLTNCDVSYNEALGGGGGAVFRTTHNLTNVTCPNDSVPMAWPDLVTACSKSWVGNTATYGNVTATIAYSLALDSPLRLPAYRSNDPLNVEVRMLDYHNQTIIAGTREATTGLEIESSRSSSSRMLLAGSSMSTAQGRANFTSTLRLQAKPGLYVLSVTAPRTLQDIAPKDVEVTVRPCVYGEVTNKEGTQCYPCDLGTFSLNTSRTACEACPDNANCSLPGFPWVTMPETGYWHSGPRSPNILKCTYSAACSDISPGWRRAKLAKYLAGLGNGTELYNVTFYRSLLCAQGYTGILCSRCQSGYGSSSSGKCTKCANAALNVLWFILCSSINIVLVFLTVHSQLPSSLDSRNREECMVADEQRDAAIEQAIVEKGLSDTQKEQSPVSDEATNSGPQITANLFPIVPVDTKDRPIRLNSKATSTTTVFPNVDEPQPQLQHSKLQQKIPVAEGGDQPVEAGPQQLQPRASSGDMQIMSRSPSSLEKDKEKDNIVQPEEIEDGPYKGGNHSVVFKILMSYLQIAAVIYSVSVPWPSILGFFLSIVQTASNGAATLVSIDCSLHNGSLPISVQRVILAVATPAIILALAVMLWLILFVLHRVKKCLLGDNFSRYMRPRVIITSIAILFFAYPDLTKTFLSLFLCPVVDPKENEYSNFMEAKGTYWNRDSNLECYVGIHLYIAVALGIPGVMIVAVGAPVFSYVWLKKHYTLLYTSPDFGVAYGFMYRDYRRETYFWESLIMMRKMVVITLVVFLQPQGEVIQIICVLGFILISTSVQITIKPYKNYRMNDLERLSLYMLVAILYFALIFLTDLPTAAKYTMGLLLTLANIALIGYFLLKIIQELWLKILWTIDSESNADGRLEWEDVWRFVEARHSKKWYTSVLVNTLKGVQRASTATQSAVSVAVVQPIGAVMHATSLMRNRLISHISIRIMPANATDSSDAAEPSLSAAPRLLLSSKSSPPLPPLQPAAVLVVPGVAECTDSSKEIPNPSVPPTTLPRFESSNSRTGASSGAWCSSTASRAPPTRSTGAPGEFPPGLIATTTTSRLSRANSGVSEEYETNAVQRIDKQLCDESSGNGPRWSLSNRSDAPFPLNEAAPVDFQIMPMPPNRGKSSRSPLTASISHIHEFADVAVDGATSAITPVQEVMVGKKDSRSLLSSGGGCSGGSVGLARSAPSLEMTSTSLPQDIKTAVTAAAIRNQAACSECV